MNVSQTFPTIQSGVDHVLS
jgi:hypothetical protein